MSRRNKKGGVSYISDSVTLVSTLFTILTMLFIAALVLFILDMKVRGEALGEVLYEGSKIENALMTLFDKTYDGHKMGDLIFYAAYFKDTKFLIDEKEYDIVDIFEEDYNNFLFDYPSSLSIDFGTEEKILAVDAYYTEDEKNKVIIVPISVDGNHYNLVHKSHKG